MNRARALDTLAITLSYAEWALLSDVLGVTSMEEHTMAPSTLWAIDAAADPALWGRRCGCRFACDCGAFTVVHSDTPSAWTVSAEWIEDQAESNEFQDEYADMLRALAAAIWHGDARDAFIPAYVTVKGCAQCEASWSVAHFVCECARKAPHCAHCAGHPKWDRLAAMDPGPERDSECSRGHAHCTRH